MKRIRLSTLLLSVTLFAVLIAWFIDHNSRPAELYLHLYSCRYNFASSDTFDDPDGWQCYATIAFTPSEEIYFHSPMFYSPTVYVEGQLNLVNNGTMMTHLKITACDPGLACEWNHHAPESIGEPITCTDLNAGMNEFMFIVSRAKESPEMRDFSNPNR